MGASSGLGQGLAALYMQSGHEVACASRRVEKIAACTAAMEIDVNSPDAPRRLMELIDRLGGMDLYVHVAGIGYDNPMLDPEREAAITQTNCVGFARMISAALDYFAKRNRKGQIAAVSSVAGTKGVGGMEAYCASKRFDWTYLEGLRQRITTQGWPVTVTDIRPGWTRTPLLKDGERYPMLMDSDYVCRRIVRAIAKERKVAYIDWRWRLLCTAWRCVPAAVWRRVSLGSMGR